jgi:hypothetical protein
LRDCHLKVAGLLDGNWHFAVVSRAVRTLICLISYYLPTKSAHFAGVIYCLFSLPIYLTNDILRILKGACDDLFNRVIRYHSTILLLSSSIILLARPSLIAIYQRISSDSPAFYQPFLFSNEAAPYGAPRRQNLLQNSYKGKGLVLVNQIIRGRELGVKQTRILIEADRPYCSVVGEACGERTRGWRLAEETVQ